MKIGFAELLARLGRKAGTDGFCLHGRLEAWLIKPDGSVIVRVKDRTYTGKVVNGILTVKAKEQLSRLYRSGVRSVVASVSYVGDAKVAPFSRKVTVKLAGRQ